MSGVLFIDTAARDAIRLAVIAMHLHPAYDASGGPPTMVALRNRSSRYCGERPNFCCALVSRSKPKG